MIEIRYGENYEVANLAGQSVAEAREQFKGEFGISGKAGARINDKKIKEKMEAEVRLADNDRLTFSEAKGGKGVFLVGAMLLALSVTGGMFAYGYTTAGVTLGITIIDADWATVSANESVDDWNVFGRYIGGLPAGPLFNVTVDSDYTGDYEVRVYLTNTEELVQGYRYLNMKLLFVDPAHSFVEGMDDQAQTNEPDWQILNLRNAGVTFLIGGSANHTAGTLYNVYLTDGNFMSHPGAWLSTDEVNPELWIEITQAGL